MTEQATGQDSKVIYLRVPAELHQQVADFAHETRRTITGAAIVLLERALGRQAPLPDGFTRLPEVLIPPTANPASDVHHR